MSDYSFELECGCLNWCRCAAEKEAVSAGFNVIQTRNRETLFECHICAALVRDYFKHNTYHNKHAQPIVIFGEL